MKTPDLKDAEPSGSFLATVVTLKTGLFLAEIDDALREVTEAVFKTKLKGKVTITMEIIPNGVGLGDMPVFKLKPDVDKTVPKLPEQGQTFFVDEQFNLMRRHPGQLEDPRLTVVAGDPLPSTGAGVSRAAKAAINS